MAAIIGTFGLVKWYTLSYTITLQSTADTQSNADLVTASGFAALADTTPKSPLKTFLTSTYASDAAAEAAFRAIGGQIVVRQVGGTAMPAQLVVQWKAAGPSTPSLAWTAAGGASNEVLEITIRVPISSIQ